MIKIVYRAYVRACTQASCFPIAGMIVALIVAAVIVYRFRIVIAETLLTFIALVVAAGLITCTVWLIRSIRWHRARGVSPWRMHPGHRHAAHDHEHLPAPVRLVSTTAQDETPAIEPVPVVTYQMTPDGVTKQGDLAETRHLPHPRLEGRPW